MSKAIPVAAVGFVAAAAWATTQRPAPAPVPVPPPPPRVVPAPEPLGSVIMSAELERSRLLAGERGETFMRVSLRGENLPSRERAPMNVVIVIDRSGSMGGRSPRGTEKMADAREAARSLVSTLEQGDTVAVVAFDNGAEVISRARPLDSAAQRQIFRQINTLYARGGTDMVAGLQVGLRQARALLSRDRVSRMILISDGHPDTERGLASLARRAADEGITVTSMGVGNDYNEDLMARIADAGQGNYYFVSDSSRMASIFKQELDAMLAVVGREARLQVATARGVKVEEIYGYEGQIDGGRASIPVGDVYAGRSSEVLVRLSYPSQSGEVDLADVKLAYYDVLAGKAQGQSVLIAGDFVNDRGAVLASLNKDVAEKVEKVKIAGAVQRAMREYSLGNVDKARDIVRSQNVATADRNSMIESEALRGEMMQLDQLEQDVRAAPASSAGMELQKSAKARARVLAR